LANDQHSAHCMHVAISIILYRDEVSVPLMCGLHCREEWVQWLTTAEDASTSHSQWHHTPKKQEGLYYLLLASTGPVI